MNNIALYISVLSGILTVGLFALVITGRISRRSYNLAIYIVLTAVLALMTLVGLAILTMALIDVLFLKKFGYPIWSIVVMLFFTLIAGTMTRWSFLLLKRTRAS
jgi:hypothetical protein